MTASNITLAYDHVVVVVEENHAFNEIIGNSQAPYINSLANGGVVLTNYHAVTHPSEPNYFAMYAGSTFGVADDGNYNEPDPTLGTVLQSGGKSFLGFVETASPRKHNPWESFPEGTSVERNFSAFPTTAGGNFAALPDVAFVVPDLNDDMHDGSVATGDQWLKTNIDAYAQWATTHHSLLVVVWDEDDASAGNQIPVVLYGANVNPGSYSDAYNHYDLLSTLAGSSSLTAPNNGATAAGLGSGIFKTSLSHWSASVDVGAHPAGWLPTLTGDFNHDGTSDLLWFNASTNDTEVWSLSNGKWSSSSDLGLHPAGWQPAGSGDFNHDGTSDLLWFNATTGDVEIWKISNGKWAGSADLGSHPAGWQPAGIGDFNHDGTSDVLWYNPTTNDIEIWKISNGQWAGSVNIGTHPAGWQPVGVGDFNHDGTSDVALVQSDDERHRDLENLERPVGRQRRYRNASRRLEHRGRRRFQSRRNERRRCGSMPPPTASRFGKSQTATGLRVSISARIPEDGPSQTSAISTMMAPAILSGAKQRRAASRTGC